MGSNNTHSLTKKLRHIKFNCLASITGLLKSRARIFMRQWGSRVYAHDSLLYPSGDQTKNVKYEVMPCNWVCDSKVQGESLS